MAELHAAIHNHCNACFKLWCNEKDKVGMSCLNISCPQECGARLHTCKLDDHLTRCPYTRIECFNKNMGCPATMARHQAAMHLIHCPANVVKCGLEFRMDNYMRHFQSDCEHDHHCAPILAEKMARHKAAEKLGEEAEYDINLPADNYTVLSKEDLHKTLEEKWKKREEAMRTHGNLFTKPRLNRPLNDLSKVPWEGKCRLLSEVAEDSMVPTSPLPAEVEEMHLTSPTSPLPGQPFSPPSLEALPFPVLKNVGRFLDSQDLIAMSLTSHYLRRVCASLLQECGMVTFGWEKQVDDSWVETHKIWQFSADSSTK